MSDLRKAPIWYCFRCKNGSPQEEWKKRSSHRWGDCPKCGAPGSKWAYKKSTGNSRDVNLTKP
jgi:hypothetical protein